MTAIERLYDIPQFISLEALLPLDITYGNCQFGVTLLWLD